MTEAFRRLSDKASAWAGSPWFLLVNLGIVGLYLVVGAIGGFTDGLSLLLTTFLTVVTQLLVVLIQGSQNRDGRATHLKLDELLRATTEARTEIAHAEDMAEEEVERVIEEIKDEGQG